jgi:hypothetical protein
MVRLRSVKAVRVLTFEEKTRVANLFTLLIEVNLQTGVANKRRSPQSTKNKSTQRSTTNRKTKHKPVKNEPSYICASNKTSRPRSSIRTARRDLYLQLFAGTFKGSRINFIWGILHHDRHHNLNTY